MSATVTQQRQQEINYVGSNPAGNNPFITRSYAVSDWTAMRNLYDEWAAQYDNDVLVSEKYTAPKLAAETVVSTVTKTKSSENLLGELMILDAGCGTGLVGVELAALGAKKIDGLDLSPGMLAVARKTGVYDGLAEADLTKPIGKDDDFYDVVTCVGTFTKSHVPPTALNELVRVAKKEGFVVATVLDSIWVSEGFEAEVKRLDESGKVKVLSTEWFGYRVASSAGARMVVLEKL